MTGFFATGYAAVRCARVSSPGLGHVPRGRTSAWPAGGADCGVGDLVGQQRVDLRGFGGGVAEAFAHDLDGDPGVDQLDGVGVGVAQLVDVDVDSGCGAVLLPPVVRCGIRQRAVGPVDAARNIGPAV